MPETTEKTETKRKSPAILIALNGKPILMHNLSITGTFRREEADMSGRKSSTKKADKGIKSKELHVKGMIPYREEKWLTDLINLAEGTDGTGGQIKYRVSSRTAQAMNIREVKFSGEVDIVEQDDFMAWNVSFILKEANSVSEKKEKRKPKPKKIVQKENHPKAQPTQAKPNKAEEKIDGTEKDPSFSGRLNQGDFKGAAKKGLEKISSIFSSDKSQPSPEK
ncbi:baseplate complex protein [Avibacterium sp. 21-594]|uniref:baseplate complex protein n=1 Tax=Avibacterium sp. 21-594 TaxID=2911535 RepID=UPI0022464EB0|nr:hypothetical protein [Avibacterium sp. 21-594]MCW9715829.1 hypothetical protein [Avibacterium sp. 21-594]